MKAVGIGIGVLIMLFVIFALFSDKDEAKSAARASIEHCWEEQGRKSLAPDEARLIAAVCERKEEDFLARYRHKP